MARLDRYGEARSLIKNATGGFGQDTILGNSSNNRLRDNDGNDGDDRLLGEMGGIGSTAAEGSNAIDGSLGCCHF